MTGRERRAAPLDAVPVTRGKQRQRSAPSAGRKAVAAVTDNVVTDNVVIEVVDRQRRVKLGSGWLERLIRKALRAEKVTAAEVSVLLCDDRRIARLHDEWMGDPTPTDVITFEHGEIVLSADTAERFGAEFGHGTAAEAALYIVHGLLHLNGFLDGTEPERAAMQAVQERIWAQCLPLE